MKQSVLVLGAGGFIGREVAGALSASSWAVPLVGVRRASASRNPQVEERVVDATSTESILAAAQGAVGIVNCVAGDESTIVGATQALCAAAARMDSPPRLIHLSSMAVYGNATGLVDESASLSGEQGAYAAAKVTSEALAASYSDSVILRPGCVFGPGSDQWSVRPADFLLARRLGDLGAAGDGYCNLVHVADVAEAVLQSLQRPEARGRAFNLSLSAPPTWNDFLVQYGIALNAVPVRRISQRRLKIESKLLAPPLKILEILARAGKLDVRRLPAPMPPSLLRLMRQEIRLDVRRAELELGLRWRTVAASITEAARWYLAGGGVSR